MSIGIIGAGYVGRAIGTYFARKGQNVVFYDINGSVVKDMRSKGFSASDNLSEVSKMKYIFVSVPTPTEENGEQNLEYILSALSKLSQLIKHSSKEQVIIIKSTILPGTTEKVLMPEIYRYVEPENVGLIYSPEFITEIHSTWSEEDNYAIIPENEPRLVIGEGENKRWGNIFLEELYPDISVPVIRTDYKTAEMIKYASNNALALKISYWNEIFLICQKLEIDSNVVAKATSLDPRIGVYGSVHGKAFGGKCLPKDLKAFIHFARHYHKVLLHEAVMDVNEYMKNKYGVRE